MPYPVGSLFGPRVHWPRPTFCSHLKKKKKDHGLIHLWCESSRAQVAGITWCSGRYTVKCSVITTRSWPLGWSARCLFFLVFQVASAICRVINNSYLYLVVPVSRLERIIQVHQHKLFRAKPQHGNWQRSGARLGNWRLSTLTAASLKHEKSSISRSRDFVCQMWAILKGGVAFFYYFFDVVCIHTHPVRENKTKKLRYHIWSGDAAWEPAWKTTAAPHRLASLPTFLILPPRQFVCLFCFFAANI